MGSSGDPACGGGAWMAGGGAHAVRERGGRGVDVDYAPTRPARIIDMVKFVGAKVKAELERRTADGDIRAAHDLIALARARRRIEGRDSL
jgi:hypothetical protein